VIIFDRFLNNSKLNQVIADKFSI